MTTDPRLDGQAALMAAFPFSAAPAVSHYIRLRAHHNNIMMGGGWCLPRLVGKISHAVYHGRRRGYRTAVEGRKTTRVISTVYSSRSGLPYTRAVATETKIFTIDTMIYPWAKVYTHTSIFYCIPGTMYVREGKYLAPCIREHQRFAMTEKCSRSSCRTGRTTSRSTHVRFCVTQIGALHTLPDETKRRLVGPSRHVVRPCD